METNNNMENEEVVEVMEETENTSSNKGLGFAGIGLVAFIVGGIVDRYIVQPVIVKYKARKAEREASKTVHHSYFVGDSDIVESVDEE